MNETGPEAMPPVERTTSPAGRRWEKDIPAHVAKGDQNWPKLTGGK
jgi:hypothetical protein